MTEAQPNRGFEWTQAPWGRAIRCLPLEAIAPHLFTIGNLRLDPGSHEWDEVARFMGVAPAAIRLIRQVHGAHAVVARGAHAGEWTSPEADVVVSDDPGLALAVRVADCAPILIADGRRSAVAAVHAGWRGIMRRAAVAAVDTLVEAFGSDPGDLVAAIGPCLGPCCGEVGHEVVESFLRAGHDAAAVERWFRTGASGRPYLDLWLASRDQLRGRGVRDENIHTAGLCTKSHPSLFHSYRAAGAGAGRMVGIIRAQRRKEKG